MHLALALLLTVAAGAPRQEPERALAGVAEIEAAIDAVPPVGSEMRYGSGTWSTHPAASTLAEHVARGGELNDDQWRRALLRSGAIRVPRCWAADEPFAIGVQVPWWLPLVEIRVEPIASSMTAARSGNTIPGCGNCARAARARDRYQVVGWLPRAGTERLAFDVTVERGARQPMPTRRDPAPAPEGPPAGLLWSGRIELDVDVLPTLADVLPPVRGAEADAAVRSALQLELDERGFLYLSFVRERPVELAAVALSLDVDVLDGESVLSTATLRYETPPYAEAAAGCSLDYTGDPARLSVRVRGRLRDAQRDWDATRHWAGELVIPVSEALPR